MNKSVFTEKELNLIKYYAVKQPVSKSVLFFICVLAAPIGFALYGAFNKDPIAILVAFLGLFIFIVWYVSTSFKNEETLNSIFNKVLKNEFSQ